uniref:T4 RNA ligase 1-like N-terminal domain-containing protein n=1 Tax=Bionectria ochroleuca TaxID=29856 RepID=A0A8H7TIR0_BIOOC
MDTAPYIAQNPEEVKNMILALEQACDRKKKGGFSCKKTSFHVKDSPTGLKVDSWKMHDWDYKRRDLPTYARGLFTSRLRNGNKEISVRGYDKFFNTDEVEETKWPKILTRTKAPYELTLKENVYHFHCRP